jgi:hypothetical protein
MRALRKFFRLIQAGFIAKVFSGRLEAALYGRQGCLPPHFKADFQGFFVAISL